MFTKKTDELKLNSLINDCMRVLHETEETTDEYRTVLDHLHVLNEMKTKNRLPRLSPDTMALIGANLIGIFMILKHERVDIITSKAMSHVLKPR